MEPTQLDVKTREQISYNMSRVRSSGSMIEKELGKALWALGLRYRKQYSKIAGKPDFAIVFVRIAVFCDSTFWHGRDWPDSGVPAGRFEAGSCCAHGRCFGNGSTAPL